MAMRKVTRSLFHDEDDNDIVNCIMHWEEHHSVELQR